MVRFTSSICTATLFLCCSSNGLLSERSYRRMSIDRSLREEKSGGTFCRKKNNSDFKTDFAVKYSVNFQSKTIDTRDHKASNLTCSRRDIVLRSILPLAIVFSNAGGEEASASDSSDDDSSYDTSFLPPGPVERSGLVVLRVAEVAAFQEKILRAILNNDLEGIVVSPQQIVFGTQILLRNSDLAGNMKLMIDTEMPAENRRAASRRAARTMNTIQDISVAAAKVERPFTDLEMLEIADMYRDVRLQLNALYDYLSPKEKEKYYGYFMQVTDYEKKIADGTYNPDVDAVLNFDD